MGASEVTRLTLPLPKEMSSFAFLAKSAISSVNKLMVFCGLDPANLPPDVKTFAEALLEHGVDVLFCPLPLSPNNLPTSVPLPPAGAVPIFEIGKTDFVCDGSYAGLKALDSKTFYALSYFVEPVVQAVAFVRSRPQAHYQKIGICGAEDSAFMALLASAVGISSSPCYLIDTQMPCADLNKNDYERSHPFFDETAKYPACYLITVLDTKSKSRFFCHKYNAQMPGVLMNVYSAPIGIRQVKRTRNASVFLRRGTRRWFYTSNCRRNSTRLRSTSGFMIIACSRRV
jgi:hypothetical protein